MNIKLINRKRIITLALAGGLLCSIASCKKDSTTTDTSISDDEVAEAVTETVSGSAGGLSTQTESSAKMASTATLTCGSASDTTIAGQSPAGAVLTYNYSLAFNRSITCENGVPDIFEFNFTGQSTYTAPRMSSSDNSSALFTVSGLQPLATAYVFNENFVRNGTQQSSVRYQRSFASTITITSTNINVDKTTQKIVSGNATVLFTGSASGGAAISRGGAITFLGGGQATLALNNGASYNIQW